MKKSIRKLQLTQEMLELLCCPKCHGVLKHGMAFFDCKNPKCNSHYPIINGVPILINEENSLFSIDDFLKNKSTYFNPQSTTSVNKRLKSLLPSISKNINAKANYAKFCEELLKTNDKPLVLVVGGSILGAGIESLAKNSCLLLIESDVSLGPRTMIVCDAHDIPFLDGSLDGVVAQAVLEHVVDPYRCADEICRVLKDRGKVYSEIPFIQQVHGGRYDFTRFTLLGHRRLFRKFEEIDSGAVCGPGMALAWTYRYFMLSFTSSKPLRKVINIFSRITSFFLKYFDCYLVKKQEGLDAASGTYFLGSKSTKVLSDQELIKRYKEDVL